MRAEGRGGRPGPRGSCFPCLALFAVALVGAGCREASVPERIVLVTLDTLRYDTAQDVASMPQLDALARSSTRFTLGYSTTSTTQPTHATLFTGQMPFVHGVQRNGAVLGEQYLTLAEVLRERGFHTEAIVSSFPLHGMFGFEQGFERFDDAFDVRYVKVWEGRETEGNGAFYSLADSVTERALRALDGAQGARQFFWFHYFDPHDPYGDVPASGDGGPQAMAPDAMPIQALLAQCGKPELEAQLLRARELYRRDAKRMDRALGRLFERLRRDESTIRTHLLITADHGESFGEAQALGHGKRVPPEQVHVPFVLRSPGITPGLRHDPVSSIDVARTLLALSNVAAPESFGGRDLREVAADASVLGMRRFFEPGKKERRTDGAEYDLPEAWFFHASAEGFLAGNGEALFVDDDPQRRAPRGERSERVRASFAELERLLEGGVLAEGIDSPEVLETLRRLGYVD